MLKYIYVFIALSTVFLHSCDEDSFSQVVTIDIPEHEPRPVVKLQTHFNDERPLDVLISNSKGILDPDSITKVPTDAEVKLYKNDELLTDFVYFANGHKYVTGAGGAEEYITDLAGDVYRLEAKIPGYETVNVEQIMPAKPKLLSASYEVEGTIDEDGYRVDELIVEVEDVAPGETNYYGLVLNYVYYDIQGGDTISVSRSYISLNSTDLIVHHGSRYDLIFTDDAFDGTDYRLRTYTYNSIGDNENIEVELYHLTKDAYLFERSLEQYWDADGNPFAEPVTVHSNVAGGYGIFSIANSLRHKIE